MSRRARVIVASVLVALGCFAPISSAQDAQPAPAAAATAPSAQSSMWLVLGGTSTTLRGDCQEDCVAHGTGAYLNTGSVLGNIGFRLNEQMDVGAEISWVPATSKAGADIRTTFVLATAQFRPWKSRGFFLKANFGTAFVRNFVFDESTALEPITQNALSLGYGAGWVFRHRERVGLQIFGAQHIAALGDFRSGGVNAENVIANYWSVGAGIVIR